MLSTWAAIALRRLRRPYNLVLTAALTIVVVVVLAALALGNALREQGERAAARTTEGASGVASAAHSIRVDDRRFTLVFVWDRRRAAASLGVPVRTLPPPGRTIVSHRLWSLLGERDATALAARARIPGQVDVGMDRRLMLGPEELVAYAGGRDEARPQHASGGTGGSGGARAGLALVTALLLLPAASMVFVAARFDSRNRSQLIADLRVLGARARQLKVVAATEAVTVAAAAVAVGLPVWLGLRAPLAASGIAGAALFPEDLSLSLGGVAVLTVVIAAVSLVASLNTIDEALDVGEAPGSTAAGAAHARRAWPALAFVLAGLATVHVAVTVAEGLSDSALGGLEIAGLALVAVGLVGLGPSLLAHIGRLLAVRSGASVPALLAGRRLEAEHAQAFRAAAGVVVVAFVFGGFAALDLRPPAPPRAHAPDALQIIELNGHGAKSLEARLKAADVVATAFAYRRVEHASLVALASCEHLAALSAAFTAPCESGRAYRTPAARHRAIGSSIAIGGEAPEIAAEATVAGEMRIRRHPALTGGIDAFIAVDPEALSAIGPTRVAAVTSDEAQRLAVLSAVAEAAPLAAVGSFDELLDPAEGADRVGPIGRAALTGALLLAGAALALAAADAALRRRETAALLFAVGMPRRARTRMAAMEVGLPLVGAVFPSLLLGFEMVYVGGRIVGGDVRVPVADLLAAVVAVAAVVALAVAATMLSVSRLPTSAILQAER